jgi:hypothetical protein
MSIKTAIEGHRECRMSSVHRQVGGVTVTHIPLVPDA